MNTAEILRAAGYDIRRAPGLEWQEKLVEAFTQALISDPASEKALMNEVVEIAREKTDNDLHIRWVMRDALDRAYLRRMRQQNIFQLYTA